MTPTRNEAAYELRRYLDAVTSTATHLDMLDAALAAEREPLLAALRALAVEPYPGILCWCGSDGGPDHSPECAEARALIEQDGRTE